MEFTVDEWCKSAAAVNKQEKRLTPQSICMGSQLYCVKRAPCHDDVKLSHIMYSASRMNPDIVVMVDTEK